MPQNRTVAFPLYPGCTLVDFAGATQVFAFADGFEPFWVAPAIEPVLTTEQVSVLPNHSFDDHPPIDILFVPGGGPAVATVMQDERFVGWIRSVAKTAEWTGSVCSGAFILAAAGLLDGHRATTYWSLLPLLARFPEITVEDGYPRTCIDPDGKRFSGGGVSSSLDLALGLVVEIADEKTAERAQLSIQYEPGPVVDAGDPAHAPPEITREVCTAQQPFIRVIEAGVEAVLGDSARPAPPGACTD